MKFCVGDKVVIEGTSGDGMIGGIHNHDSEMRIKHLFGHLIRFDKCWDMKLVGEIYQLGLDNHYVIVSGTHYYNFCNIYNEMRLEDGSNATEK